MLGIQTPESTEKLALAADTAACGPGRPAEVRFNSVVGEAFLSSLTVQVDDMRIEHEARSVLTNTRSEIAVPLLLDRVAFGAINLESPRLAHYGPASRARLEGAAAALAARLNTVHWRNQLPQQLPLSR